MCCSRKAPRHRALARAAATGLSIALAAALGLAAAGCGNKKPPRAPSRMVPAAVTDLTIIQRGSELQFELSYPALTTAGLPLAGLEAIELWRMTRPLAPPPADEEEDGDEPLAGEAEAAETAAPPEEPDEEDAPPATPFLFRRPTVEAEIKAEDRVLVDPREFLALAAVELRIEGAELTAAISGDRVLLRLPLGELPAPEVPEEERSLELFGVICVSSRGLGSEMSNLVKILPRTPPAAPEQIDTRPGATGIDVVWRAADDPAVGFRVYRRDAASRAYGPPIARPLPAARSHLDQTTRFDSAYVYTVTAVALESPLVESALAVEREVQYEDRYAPPRPSGLIVLAEPGRARLLWEPSPAGDLAGYLVYRRAGGSAGFDRLTAEPSLELNYLDSAVASGASYAYYVSAIDRSGNESEASDTVDVEVP